LQDPEIASRIASYELAFRMQAAAPELVELSDESSATLEMYGVNRKDPPIKADRAGGPGQYHAYATNCLLARRLVERGVRFVNVTWDLFWDRVQINYDAWDTHTRNFAILKDVNLPEFDQTYTALLEDLKQRGTLDNTLIVAMGEFGRTPQLNPRGGRDHWPGVWSVLFAGAGVRGGQVIGKTDKIGAFPTTPPYSPNDVGATVYQALGVDPESEVRDRQGRPVRLNQGRAIEALYSGAGA